VALFLAFCLAQLISSIIAAYGDWGFTAVVSNDFVRRELQRTLTFSLSPSLSLNLSSLFP
jgi:hypothetical protein